MPVSNSCQIQKSSLETFVALPRFLQVVPSLLVLTTAIAWGTSSHAGGRVPDSGLRGDTAVTVAAGPVGEFGAGAGVGVGLGAPGGAQATTGLNSDLRAGVDDNVTAGQRRTATGAANAGRGAQPAAGLKASAGVNGATESESAGRTLGGGRNTGQALGSPVARTGKMTARAAKADVSGGVKGEAQGAAGGGASASAGAVSGVTLGN